MRTQEASKRTKNNQKKDPQPSLFGGLLEGHAQFFEKRKEARKGKTRHVEIRQEGGWKIV